MGVPKFFKYISARYPCLSETLKQYQIPEFDNLYLDMNGIIHNSSHPNDNGALFYLSEEEIFKNIFHYVEVLFRMIQPQSLFFMAVDGVAPRAKINHQRSRRFKTAKDAEIQEAKAKAKGIEIQEDKKFDSNCITPGTVFMTKLNEQLKYFVTYKVSTDKLWQRCKVIFSGSEVPGEGEHKIMDYIRYLKSQPDYNVNTRHCLYGLDADLIMLGLCTHEPYFSLLRGDVKLSEKKQKRIIFPEETKFCLLHLSLLRDYINHEFCPIKDKLSFGYDLEKIIDDWILMGFLVGNDFIPHLPNLHIANGALEILYHVYMEVLPTLDGYINESGTLRLDRFEKFMEKLSRVDLEQFAEYYATVKFFEGKTGRRPDSLTKHSHKLSVEETEEDDSTKKSAYPDLNSMCESTDMPLGNSDEDDETDSDSSEDDYDEDMYNAIFAQHKKDYYMNKLEYENVDEDVLRSQSEGYVRAIQWNLYYYYYGCCSWSWFYPHHYAPYISDIKDFKDLKLEFELGEPFLPFQQLLAVLPKYSKNLLPPAFQDLLSDENSPIIDYYPVDFKTDLNGKRQEWEAVVLIPFISDTQLLDAMAPHMHKLTPEECERNKHGPMSLYTYTNENLGICKAPEYFGDVMNHAKVQLISLKELFVPREKLVMGICPGLNLDICVLGFPKLRHIEHTASLEKADVKLFEQASKSEKMILRFVPQSTPPLADVASQILGKIVYVEWPYLTEAQVIAVSNNGLKINLINPEIGYSLENISREEFKGSCSVHWISEKKRITAAYKTRLGVDVGITSILVDACPITGSRYIFDSDGKVYFQREWSQTPITYAYQAVVTDIPMLSTSQPQYKSIDEIFTPGSICFMLSRRHYGETAEVLKYETKVQSERIDVFLKVPNEPVLKSIKQMYTEKKTHYMQCNVAAQRLGISSHLFSRITGTIHVAQGINEQQKIVKHNVGLNLKFNKRNEEIPGYTKKEHGQWLYSTKVIDLIRSYMAKCPDLFERLATNVANDIYLEDELFDKTTEEFSSVVAWLKEQLRGIESRPCGADILDIFLVQKLEELIDTFVAEESEDKYLMIAQIKVKAHLLFKPGLHSRNSPPDPNSQNFLFDRVVCVRESFTVPLGLRGTIIGIQKAENVLDTVYDILFDKSFLGGISLNGSSASRGYRLLVTDFVNINHGKRMEYSKEGISDVKVVDTRKQLSKLPNSWRTTPPFRVENNHSSTSPPNSSQVHIVKKNTDNKDRIKLPNSVKWKQQQQDQCPIEDCTDVKVDTEHASPQGPQKPSAKITYKFQALWNELHKTQESYMSAEKLSSTSTGTKTKQPPKYVNKNSPQDSSAFLKAVLKISDDSTQSNTVPKSTSPTVKPPTKVVSHSKKISDTPPPLVQQLFDHARQTEKKKDEKNPIWYCSRLLNHFQLTGMGMPRYSYFTEGDNLIRAHILLPDSRVFAGNFCATHAQAAESAAEKVYKELHLDKTLTPDAKILLSPPNQWYNSQQNPWSQNIIPVMPTCSMKVHQLPQNPVTQFPKWNPQAQQNVGYQTAASHTNQNQSQQKQNMFKQPIAEVKNNTPFVPLQAQKKSRSIKVKRTAKDASQNVKENPSITIQRKNEETLPKVSGEDNLNTNQSKHESDTSVPGNNSQHSSKSQKSGKPRRSRVAAKFGAVSLTNEAESQ